MTLLLQSATRLWRLLLRTLYRMLRGRIVVQPGHRASQVAAAIAEAGHPVGV